MLNELRKLEPTYQKFTIDKHLKKYESALKHLKDCGPEHEEECLKFVSDQKLHAAALKIFPPAHPLYQVNFNIALVSSVLICRENLQTICREYAVSLMSSQYYEEAGIIFQRAQGFSEAVEAFRKAGCWRKIVPLVPKLGFSKEKTVSFYEELGHDMRERRLYLDSALIFGELVNKPEERFLSLCKAKAWDEALRVQSMHDVPGSGKYFHTNFNVAIIRFNLFSDQMLRFEVVNHQSSTMSDLETASEQVSQYTSRLLVVRAEKAKRLEEGAGKFDGYNPVQFLTFGCFRRLQ